MSGPWLRRARGALTLPRLPAHIYSEGGQPTAHTWRQSMYACHSHKLKTVPPPRSIPKTNKTHLCSFLSMGGRQVGKTLQAPRRQQRSASSEARAPWIRLPRAESSPCICFIQKEGKSRGCEDRDWLEPLVSIRITGHKAGRPETALCRARKENKQNSTPPNE